MTLDNPGKDTLYQMLAKMNKIWFWVFNSDTWCFGYFEVYFLWKVALAFSAFVSLFDEGSVQGLEHARQSLYHWAAFAACVTLNYNRLLGHFVLWICYLASGKEVLWCFHSVLGQD